MCISILSSLQNFLYKLTSLTFHTTRTILPHFHLSNLKQPYLQLFFIFIIFFNGRSKQLSPSRSMADENNPIMEGIPELTLHTHANELIVLCETIVDFKNLKKMGLISLKPWNFKVGKPSLKENGS